MKPLPIPSDFAEQFAKLRRAEVAAHYGVSIATIRNWRQATGVEPTRFRLPMKAAPKDFAERAAGLSLRKLSEHYGVGEKVVRRWYRETGAPQKRVQRGAALEMPADFAAVAPTLAVYELERRYGRHYTTIQRWLRTLGILPKKAPPHRGGRRSRPEPKRKPAKKGTFILPGTMAIPPALIGREQEAAQFLRRFYPWVYRSTEQGAASERGKFWRLGNIVETPGEMIIRATLKGWHDREGGQ